MTKTIQVNFDSDNMTLDIQQPDEAVRIGELVEWIFNDVPADFAPWVMFKSLIDDDDESSKYFGPFLAFTQEIPGADGNPTRVWGVMAYPKLTTHRYRVAIEKGVGEDPFDEAYGNTPGKVGKAVVISGEGKLRVESHKPSPEILADERRQHLLEVAQATNPLPGGSGSAKVIPISERHVDGEVELCIHDDFLWVQRSSYDTVIWDFGFVPRHEGCFPIVDFIGGEGMAYEDIVNMHFGPFSALTYTMGRVIGTGHGEVPGGYHYRVAMAEMSSKKLTFKSSPDPVVDYPEPGGSGGGG